MDVEIPFKRMPWQEAMDRFGSDKPDTRFGMELCDVSRSGKGLWLWSIHRELLKTVALSAVSM